MNHVRNFIVTVSENYYNEFKLEINENAENVLSDFVYNPQTLLLQSILHSDHTLLLTAEIQSNGKSIIFYKTQAKELLSEDAVKEINFISFSHNAVDTLYQMLRQIYSPLLAKGNDLYSNTLHKNITDLESNLKVLTYGKSDGSVDVILTMEDEAEYWKLLGIKKDSNKKEIEASKTFSELFNDITEEIRTMQSSSMSDIRESTENIGGLLDEIWRFTTKPYPQDRMTHIINIIGHNVCSVIQKQISSPNLWKVHNSLNDSELLKLLSESLDVIQTWISACRSLTETYWPNYALHIWNGNPYVPQFCINFESRVMEIQEIRCVHNQLEKLLSFNERSEYRTDELFLPFEGINIWIYNAPHKEWEMAMSRFTSNLRAAETKVAEKLKSRLHNVSTKQMLYEFLRYKTLIRRPVVKQALYNELEIFVSSLKSMLKEIQEQLDADEMDVKMYQPPEMSPVVQQIQWMKQMEAKVKDVKVIAEEYLTEFNGSVDVSRMSIKLLTDLKVMYTQLYDDWCKDLQAELKSGSLQLQLDKPVVEFSDNKMMSVRFNRRVVWSEGEARALAALRLPPPAAAQQLDLLARNLAHAHQLHQIASFHNTIGERMIPSTRPMMLQAALDLSAAVQDQKAVYWDDEQQLINYIEKLKLVVKKLETQNTYLTGEHIAIRSIVERLADTEILAKHGEWKKGINEIRNVIEKVEANGYKKTELWRTHWDGQLYKTMECQYIKTLLSLHKNFPSYRVDLVLRGHKVRVQPPLEEVRVHHYNQLRRLVSLPATYVGLQDSVTDVKSIFASIVDKHSWLGNKAVTQLEAAFSSLERVCLSWTKKAALACVPDLEALCSETLKEPTDWEVNFKACKAYGQAVAKMSFEDEKIDWITVGTATLRREFEAQTRSLWSCLMSSLQTSCRSDVTNIEAFIANATIMMENKALPKNAKELAEVSAKQQALANKMPEMEKLVEMLKCKSHLLRTWGGDPSLDETLREWKQTREMMLSHQKMFEHQAEIVKSSLNGEFENLNTSLEAWLSRWDQNKMKFESTHGVQYSEMVDRCRQVFEAKQQWDKFVTDRDDLLKECTKFNLAPSVSESWQEAEKLITEYINLWSMLQQYHEELESLSEQDWLVFHKRLHLLDEFTTKWSSRLEPFTFITLFIQQELDKYADLHVQLKYLRGADFTERHWHEVYNLLEMEYKRPDALKLKDLLNVSANIKKHIVALQKINANSQSESAIRAALSDLEIWFAGARFTITYYNDKNKRPTPIVKDYKEILNKVEEQQWVLSSISVGSVGGGDACAAWEVRVRSGRNIARTAHRAQRRWLYLEPILSNDDGDLGLKFRKVDQGFRQVMRMVESDPRLSALLQSTRLQPMLDSISDQLLACQSALNQYIEEKRSIFPRLYFLSDDDLLELLGQARAGAEGREVVMQTHLKKLFPGITGVRLGPGGLSVTALCSQFDETFQLDHPVDIDCAVEMWLKNLESEMRSSLKNMIHKCMLTNSLNDRDPFSLPTQILCLAQNIRFTEQVEKAITSKDLHKLKANLEKENSYYAETDVVEDKERIKRQALILQCTHYLYVVQTLIDNNVVLTSDWLWQKQLRFYLINSKEVVAKMGLAQISYSYEYLGVNTGQFVRTELADECFFILTQALHLNLVGNPFGPAGTGKTESVKALGGLMGRLVLIFNCDEAMDAQCMGRLLSGVAVCGAWGCFDEFNRLSSETLATVTHQLTSLLAASGKNNKASINGKQITVSEWCGVAATMNPAGRGYGGRQQLPAALQAVLRPVAMTTPAQEQLARHLLAASSIKDAKQLAADLHTVFDLASSLLSDQRHYDWGLRALKAAVGSCASTLANNTNNPRAVLRTVLRLNNYSKLTTRDAERFENILALVFGDVAEEKADNDPIRSSISTSLEGLGLVENKLQTQKCMELYEQLQQRMGVVIVGPPGSGKSTIRQLLKTALTNQGRTIEEYIICPKAMCRGWLLGNIDPDTRQWTDGAISATALEVTNQPDDVWSWVVCDGDIDPEWIEALNSVLDDNRLLTLPSGWRIQFGSNVNFIFETHSLEHASPATISRMGIILLSDDTSCALEVSDSWLQKADCDNETVTLAIPLLHKVIKKCIEWLRAHKADVLLKICDVEVVKQILTQFESVASNININPMHISPEEIVYTAVNRSLTDVIKPNAVDQFHDELSEILGPAPSPAYTPTEWITDNLLITTRLSNSLQVLRASAVANQHLIIVGPDACAKNLLAEYVLKDLNLSVITIDCTPMLEPEHIIAELKRNNALRTGGGAPNKGSRVVLLVRSIHRARIDCWGSSAVHALLQQLMQRGCVWSRGGEEAARAHCDVTVLATTTQHHVLPAPHTYITEPDEEELSELVKHYLRQNIHKNIDEKHVTDLVNKMLAIYKEVTDTFTSRPHYKWNASHLRKWCENIKLYSTNNIEELYIAIFAEANSIFHDRLVTDQEKSEYTSISRKYLKLNNEDVYFNCKLRSNGVMLETVDKNEWYFTTQKLINQCLTEHDYNVFGETGAEACAELAVLCPAMAKVCHGGLVVCIGSSGIGRKAAVGIAAASINANIAGLDANAILSAGEGNRTIIVLSESSCDDSSLGCVEALIKASSLYAIPAKVLPSTQPTQNMFENIKQNLGIVICLDKDQPNLAKLIEKYPFLYNDGHCIWIERLSDETLREMPKLVVQRLKQQNASDNLKEELDALPTEGFVNIYNSIDTEWRRTPCRYINFIKSYYHIVNKKKTALLQRKEILSRGVEALVVAREEVSRLQSLAGSQETALYDKQQRANLALDQISATVRDNNTHKLDMQRLQDNMQLENQNLQIRLVVAREEVSRLQSLAGSQETALYDKQQRANLALDQISATVRDNNTHKLDMQRLQDNMQLENQNLQIRLVVAREEVSRLQSLAGSQETALYDKQQRANLALDQISATVRDNNTHKLDMQRLQDNMQLENQNLQIRLVVAREEVSRLQSLAGSQETALYDKQQRANLALDQISATVRDNNTHKLDMQRLQDNMQLENQNLQIRLVVAREEVSRLQSLAGSQETALYDKQQRANLALDQISATVRDNNTHKLDMQRLQDNMQLENQNLQIRLVVAREEVSRLQSLAGSQETALYDKQQRANLALDQISATVRDNNTHKLDMQRLQDNMQLENQNLQIRLVVAREEVSRLQSLAGSQETALYDKQQRANLALDQISATVRDNNTHKLDMQRLQDNMQLENQNLQIRLVVAREEVSRLQSLAGSQETALYDKQQRANLALDQISATVRDNNTHKLDMQRLQDNMQLENQNLQIRLVVAREEVSRLQSLAGSQETALYDKQQRANLALDQISATVRDNNTHKLDMQRLQDNMQLENQNLQIRKKEIEAELATVEPVVAAARAAVAEIKPEALSEVRSLRAPPDVVRDVLEGVLRLMGIADTSWHSMKNFLSKRGVKEDIRCVDASQISPEAVSSVEKLLERRAASFTPEVARRASAAVAPLAAWVRANLAHAQAQARVAPLREQQDRLTRNLKEAEAELSALSSGLLTVDERVASLKEQLGQYTREAAAIELKLTNAKETIDAANNLLQQLQRENVAWEKDLEYISKEISELSVRSLLAAAYIVFVPDCTEPEALIYQKQWASLIGFQDETFSVINFLSSAEKQLKWDADGLPLDKSAIKNAVSIDQFLEQQKIGFTPLIIDPDGNAISWLKATLKDVQCEFVSQSSDNLSTAVQYAIRIGRILVITDVEIIPDTWTSIIQGNNSARLILYTRDATIATRLQPQLIARLSLLQFTARLHGLTDQLVQYALQQQNPEVNQKSKELKLKKAELQKQQHELQENLLKDLSSNSDILHDANLLASLNKTQSTNAIITEALEAASTVEQETRSACEMYEKTAYRAALLTLAVKGIVKKKPLVALPVDTALNLYVDAIRKTGTGKTLNNEQVVKYFTRRVIERVLLAVHTRDKYTVVLHLLKEVYDDLIPDHLWQVFIGRHDQVDEHNVQTELGNYTELTKDCIQKLAYIKQTNEDFYNRLSLKDETLWKKFQSTGDLALLGSLNLNHFEVVIAAACMKPDSLYRAVVALVDYVLGSEVVSSRDVLHRCARAAAPSPSPAPALPPPPALLLSAHALLHDALQVGIEEGISAWESALESTRSGGWLAVIVGASPFSKELHHFIQTYMKRPAEDFSEDFRLWIVCEEREIPPLISNTCITVILEPPEGVKANALSTLSSWGKVSDTVDVLRMRVHLALFHAIVQQRRQYIPQGWSRWYSWEQAELQAAVTAASGGAGGGAGGGARALVAALYGAHAQLPADARLLHHLLHHVCADSTDMPRAQHLQAYIPWLESLPALDSAELLRLPANCRRAWEQKAMEHIIAGLKELSSTVNTHKKDGGSTPLKNLLAMWKKHMSGSPLLKADFNPDKGSVSWWECVSGGEAWELSRAVKLIHTTLAHCRANNTTLHTVPEEWQLSWSGPRVPARYLAELCHRARAAHAALASHTALATNDYYPTTMCAQDVCSVERVVAGLRARTHAAHSAHSAHSAHTHLTAHWDPHTENPNGLIITGLMLSGGEWDKSSKAIRMCGVDSAPAAPAPPILLQFVKQSALLSESSIEIPVYNNESRERALLYVQAPLTHTFTRRLAHLHSLALFVAPLE